LVGAALAAFGGAQARHFSLFSRATPAAFGGAQARHFLSLFRQSQTGALRSGLVKFLIRKT
jgi:hypothetical protein